MPEDRAEGLAGRNVEASLKHPNQSSPDHAEAGDGAPSHRSLTGHGDPGQPGADRTEADRGGPDRPRERGPA